MTTYKQPRRINAVSVVLVVLLGAAGYVGYRAWPVVALHGDIKNALEDSLPRYYRANLLPEPECSILAEEVRTLLIDKLGALGIRDPERALTMTRNTEEVAITARVETSFDLGIVGRRIPVTLAPRVRTNAARVTY